MFKKLLPLLFLFAGFHVNASIIFNGYTHDTATDIVTGGGLEWLQWDYTVGQSIDTALAGAATTAYGGGWALASNTQMAGLFNTFGFGAFGTDENTHYYESDAWNVTEVAATDNELMFILMFGDTYKLERKTHECYWIFPQFQCKKQAKAYFGSDADDAGLFHKAFVVDDFINNNGYGSMYRDGYVWMTSAVKRSTTAGFADTGVALVRSVTVPEPSIIALFGLGLVGIGFARRRRS
jgi:hypothetical protein